MALSSVPIPFDQQYLRFLAAEESASERLRSFYAQSREELRTFLLDPPVPLTASEQQFFNSLSGEVNRLADVAQVESTKWLAQSVPQAFVEGALQHSPGIAFTVLHDDAVKSLSGYTLNQITRMNDGMRRIVQQQIGTGLLEGLTRQQVSDRILASGLSNIPHWRTIEERAAAIARTEMMRAYNAGNLAGILDAGGIAVRWITGVDERVCPICGPRHDHKYRAPGMTRWPTGTPAGDVQAWRDLDDLPGGPPPAHVKCRCTIRAFFFDDEKAVTPTPVPGGIIESTPTPVPLAPPPDVFDDLFARTMAKRFPTTEEFDAAGIAWKGMRLDEERLRRIATEFDDDAFGFVFGGRYGVRLEVDSLGTASGRAAKAWANPEFRYRLLSSMERVRLASERYIVGSPYFTRLMITTQKIIRKRGVLADASPTGLIRLNMSSVPEYLTKELRGGVNGIEEILVHEIAHTIHNRYGFAGFGFKAIEDLADDAYSAWQAIRAKTARAIFEPGKLDKLRDTVKMQAARLEEFEKAQAEFDRLATVTVTRRRWSAIPGVGLEDYEVDVRILYVNGRTFEFAKVADVDFQRTMAQSALDSAHKQLRAYEDALHGGDLYPTEYASRGNLKEDFAESMMLYLLNPTMLKTASPLRFEYMRDVIFR